MIANTQVMMLLLCPMLSYYSFMGKSTLSPQQFHKLAQICGILYI